MTDIKIGDRLCCDRDYGRNKWRDSVITGETKFSWLVGGPWTPSKVNKKTMLESNGQFPALRWYTEQGMNDEKFKREHVHKIAGALLSVDADTLRRVAALIGYTGHIEPEPQ